MRYASAAAAALVFGFVSFQARAHAEAQAALGRKVQDFRVEGPNGVQSLSELKGKEATVIVFLSFDCPLCTSHAPVLTELAKHYDARGVAFIGLITEKIDAATIDEQVRQLHITFPVLKDNGCRAADLLQAQITPEAFVLDKDLIMRYRGRIDNSHVSRLKKNRQTTSADLRDALDDLLAARPVRTPATQAVGCAITRPRAVAANSGAVTYYRDVLPILQKNCQTCHRPGEVGPFSLMTFSQAARWADDIKEFTQSRRMPPWKPVDGPAFHNERKLSAAEVAVLAAWVDGGAVEGDSRDAPPPRQFVDGWQLGVPDLVLQVQPEFQVAAAGKDVFRCFVLHSNLAEDTYVTGVEVRPGNAHVVHHALLFVDTSGQGRKLEEAASAQEKPSADADFGPGYTTAMGIGFAPKSGMGGWAPGLLGRKLPEGTGYFLPKGSDVILQVHYHRNGRLEKDSTRVGLYFARGPVARRYQGITVAGSQQGVRFFVIPPGAERFRVQGTTWVDQDCEIYSIMPHMHLIGRAVKVTMTAPGAAPLTLIDIPDWDYNWQEVYFFEKPIVVKAGTRFDIEAQYDNSAKNPNNPNDPPRIVVFGEQTTNEMCFGFLGAAADKPGRIRQHNRPQKGDGGAGKGP
jgi:peroxiredoxin